MILLQPYHFFTYYKDEFILIKVYILETVYSILLD